MFNVYIILLSYYIICGLILVYFYVFINTPKKMEIKNL